MKKSINAWSIPSQVPMDEMFRQAAEAGFDGIELNIDKEGASAHALSMHSAPSDYAAIRSLSETYRLPVVSISTSLFGGLLGSPCAAQREAGKDIIRKQLECADALGADGILTVPGGMTDDISMLAAYENCYRAYEEIKSELSSTNIRIGVENVWNGFFSSPFDMAGFIDKLDCPAIGAYFDVGNVAAFSEPEDWIEILGSRIIKVHVKDFQREGGYHRGGSFVNLLQGSIHWDKVAASLRKAGFNGYLTAELATIPLCPAHLYHMTVEALDIITTKL